MPIYEYECYDCQDQVEIFFRSFSDLETKTPLCPQCKGANLERLISKVTVVEGGGQAGTSKTNRNAAVKDDSQRLAQTMRQAQQSSGQNLGRDFNEVAGRLERGEKATKVEQSLRKRVGEKMGPH